MNLADPKRHKQKYEGKRRKLRYFLIEFITTDPKHTNQLRIKLTSLPRESIHHMIIDVIQKCWGMVGHALFERSLKVSYYSSKAYIFILKCPRSLATMLSAVIPLVTEFKGIPCALRTIHVSGTLLKCQQKAVDYNLKLLKQLGVPKTDMEKEIAKVINIRERNSEKRFDKIIPGVD